MSLSVLEFPLPDLGEGLTDAEIVRWLVDVGDAVAVDQPVVEVETAKAAVEVPCPYAGTVTRLWAAPGESVDVGKPLLSVAPQVPGNVLVGFGPAAPEATRRRSRPSATDSAARAEGPVAVTSPAVRRLARERGIDLRSLTGTGAGGLILRADVERAVASAQGADGIEERVPLRGVRGAVADKLSRSRREIPDATCWVDADATELLAVRDAADLSLLALLARICTAALARHPELNATVDTRRGEIVRLRAVHLGIATGTEHGLVVPVVRDAHARTTERLAAEIIRLTEGARAATLAPAELTGGTFTLNNYGVLGVDGATPIINYPEAGMLGVGRIATKPWVHQGELSVRRVVQLSCTFDHRVCDGATAGGFLRFVADCVEQPAVLLRAV